MKNEYRDKLKNLEQRLESDNSENVPDQRIKVIEDRIAKIQEAIDHTSGGEKIIRANPRTSPGKTYGTVRTPRSKGSTPTNENAFNPSSTWQGGRITSKSPPRLLQKNNSRPNSRISGTESSPLRDSARQTASPRSLSRKRLEEPHVDCQRCIKRHGHEWAKSPR